MDCQLCNKDITGGIDTSTYYVCEECHAKQETLPKYTYSLLNLCEAVHMKNTGAFQDMTKEEYAQAVRTISSRISNWTRPSSPYDNSVLELAKAVMLESCF